MESDKRKIVIFSILMISFLAFSFHLYTSLPVKSYTISSDCETGKMLWQKYNCSACHQIYGLGGFLGADLTNEYSLRGEEFIKAFLKTGTETMPNFNLSDREIAQMISYLKNVDASGKADPRTFVLHANGTIEQ